jgi:hypothetical protein
MRSNDAPRADRSGGQPPLVPLSALRDHRLADGEPDIRGWPVRDADDRAIGEVEELLVDARTDEVAALAVTSRAGDGSSVRVLSLADARIDDRGRRVQATLRAAEFDALPTAADARGATPGVTVERTADGGSVIRVPIVEEQLVVERRPVVKEVLVIRKRAVTEEQVVEADLRRERVDVEQRDTRSDSRR